MRMSGRVQLVDGVVVRREHAPTWRPHNRESVNGWEELDGVVVRRERAVVELREFV